MDTRILFTDMLRAIRDEAHALGFSEVMDPEELDEVDPYAWHLLAAWTPIADGTAVRGTFVLKLKDETTPFEARQDMTWVAFHSIPSVSRDEVADYIKEWLDDETA